jgi:hypothetical protein
LNNFIFIQTKIIQINSKKTPEKMLVF